MDLPFLLRTTWQTARSLIFYLAVLFLKEVIEKQICLVVQENLTSVDCSVSLLRGDNNGIPKGF